MKNLFFLILFLFFISCSPKSAPPVIIVEEPAKPKIDYAAEGYTKATVIDLTGLSGCKFLLQLEDETKLQPENLDSAFAKKGLPVWVKYYLQKNAVSNCMSGRVVHITDIVNRVE